ncbi:hypothetical protein LR48_Vigan10g218400 [Vigna angularis]|uniref:Uncharacterized protein n=1 Tax=Phaseolus angularis TaxID=3914 RepID=A0A0L9VN11_PHAAN|nr:hypothetical protein LR48_Vigan10g218400 [Vigna angularis]
MQPVNCAHGNHSCFSSSPSELDCGGGVSVRGVSRCGGGLCWNVGWQGTAVVGCAGTFKVEVVFGVVRLRCGCQSFNGETEQQNTRIRKLTSSSFLHPLTHRPRTTAYHHLHTTATGTPTPPHHQRLSNDTKRISKRCGKRVREGCGKRGSRRKSDIRRRQTDVPHPFWPFVDTVQRDKAESTSVNGKQTWTPQIRSSTQMNGLLRPTATPQTEKRLDGREIGKRKWKEKRLDGREIGKRKWKEKRLDGREIGKRKWKEKRLDGREIGKQEELRLRCGCQSFNGETEQQNTRIRKLTSSSFLHPLTHRPRTTAYHHLHTTATGTPTPPHHQRLSDGTKRISKRMWEESERRMWEERELTEVGHPSKANGCPTSVLAFRGHCSARQSRKHQRKRKTNLDAADPLLHPDERPPPPNGYSTNGPPENEKERKGLLKMKKKEREE